MSQYRTVFMTPQCQAQQHLSCLNDDVALECQCSCHYVSAPYDEPEPISITSEQRDAMLRDPMSPKDLIAHGYQMYAGEEYTPEDENNLGAALLGLIAYIIEHGDDYAKANALHVKALISKAIPIP